MVDDVNKRLTVGPLPDGYFALSDEEAEEHDLEIAREIQRQLGIEPNA